MCWAVTVVTVLCMLEFKINIPKGMLTPAQYFVYIGDVDGQDDSSRRQNYKDSPGNCCGQDTGFSSSKTAAYFTRTDGVGREQVPLRRLYLRPLQYCLHSQFRVREDPLDTLVTLEEKAMMSLDWWKDLQHISRTRSRTIRPCDDSLHRYVDVVVGSSCRQYDVLGEWSTLEHSRSINQLEV